MTKEDNKIALEIIKDTQETEREKQINKIVKSLNLEVEEGEKVFEELNDIKAETELLFFTIGRKYQELIRDIIGIIKADIETV